MRDSVLNIVKKCIYSKWYHLLLKNIIKKTYFMGILNRTIFFSKIEVLIKIIKYLHQILVLYCTWEMEMKNKEINSFRLATQRIMLQKNILRQLKIRFLYQKSNSWKKISINLKKRLKNIWLIRKSTLLQRDHINSSVISIINNWV